jgi:cellulose biosynthesis protein BcsQ
MPKFALWNNKGGVGKSFLSFALACEYALENPDEEVLLIDLCPQANLSEIILGGQASAADALVQLYAQKPRRSVGGYLEARLTSPFIPISNIRDFLCSPFEFNKKIPRNVSLLAGDNLVELLSEAIRQASQMSLPNDAWKKVMYWIDDLIRTFTEASKASDVVTFIDCNPSFSIYTQIALSAADYLIIPFTADDSSRRGIENVLALLYGVSSSELQGYAKLSFSRRAAEEGVDCPRLHTFVSNRVTMYKGKPSSAFLAKEAPIRSLIESVATPHKRYFDSFKTVKDLFAEMPDYHSVAVVASSEGAPLSVLKSGHHQIDGQIVQVNQAAIGKYTKAIKKLTQRI